MIEREKIKQKTKFGITIIIKRRIKYTHYMQRKSTEKKTKFSRYRLPHCNIYANISKKKQIVNMKIKTNII